MKSGQQIENNLKNIFVAKSYTKFAGELLPDPYLKRQN